MSRILITDDYPDTAAMLCAVLRMDGFEADVAMDGDEAMNLYEAAWDENRPYDLLILDLAMPHMTGPEVAEHIRDCGDITTKIAFLTAYIDPMTPARAKVLNVCALWRKPMDSQQLCDSVRQLFTSSAEGN